MTLISPAANKPRVTVDELNQIYRGVERMLGTLWPAVEAGEFGIIIGDDTSGRIPALITRKVINRWNLEHGLPKIPIVFIAGTSNEADFPAQERAFQKRERLLQSVDRNKRALIVTEGVTTGGAIASIGRLLTAAGFGWDVAALDGDGFKPRRPSEDAEKIQEAKAEWAARKKKLRAEKAGLESEVSSLTESNTRRRQQYAGLLDARLTEVATQKSELKTTLEAEEAAPKGWLRGRRQQRQQIKELTLAISACDNDEKVASHRAVLAECDATDNKIAKKVARIAQIEIELKAKPDYSQVLGGDERAVWADDTRLFRGKHNAQHIRDRTDMTGLSQEKFSSEAVLHDDKTRQNVRRVRTGIEQSIDWYLDHLSYRSNTVRSIYPATRKLIDQLRTPIVTDRYGVIVGDDTSGRLPAVLIAKVINVYAKRHGRPRVPTLFIEGIRATHDKNQIKAFAKLERSLQGIDRSKRALVVTDNFSDSNTSGMSAGSIAWRLHEAGFKVDIATISEKRLQTAARIESGVWPPGSRGFAGGGDPDVLINNASASGLSQRRPKFGSGLVLRDAKIRQAVIANRHDISHTAALRLANRLDAPILVQEVEAIMPGMRAVLKELKTQIHADTISAVIGEDGGGRIPALVAGKTINAWRRAQGLKPIPVFFITATADDASKEALDRRYGAIADRISGGRALFFTGNVHSAKTAGPAAWWLHGRGVAVDVIPPRQPDHRCQQYIDAEVLPPDTKFLTEAGVPFYDTTAEGVNLHAHSEVTGIRRFDDGTTRAAVPDVQPQVALARGVIKKVVPTLVREL